MPKRKRKGDDCDYEILLKKLKKIEREVKDRKTERRASRRRVRVLSSSSSDSLPDAGDSASFDATASAAENHSNKPDVHQSVHEPSHTTNDVTEPTPAASQIEPAAPATGTESVFATNAEDCITLEEYSPELEPEVLEILGIDPTNTTKYGNDIQKDLAIRLEYNATEGLSKEARKELIDLYLIPNNCKKVGSPALKLELKAALSDMVLKRDASIEAKQKVTSAAISSISQAITRVLSSKEKDTKQLLQMLMDAGRLICDNQHSDSLTRRNFVLYSIKKEMRESLQNTKIDTLLFGESLSDTLKAAKAINKSGSDLKVPTPPKAVTSKAVPTTSKNC